MLNWITSMFSHTMKSAIASNSLSDVERLVNADNKSKDAPYSPSDSQYASGGPYTPLIDATIQGRFKIVEFLIKNRANTNSKILYKGKFRNALDFALIKVNEFTNEPIVNSNSIEVYRKIAQILFIEIIFLYATNPKNLMQVLDGYKDFDLNPFAPSVRSDHTIITFVSKNGYIDTMDLLLKKYNDGFLIEINTKKAWEFAAESNHWDTVRLLFEVHAAKCSQRDGDISIYLDEIIKLSDFLLKPLDLSTKLQLSIIREIDYTTESSLENSAATAVALPNEPKDRILLQISTSASSHFVFKLVCLKTTKKWHIAFSDITEEDLRVSNVYLKKVVEVGMSEYNDYFKEMINTVREQETIDSLQELFLGIENIEHSQISRYEDVSYLSLVRRIKYSVEERVTKLERGQDILRNNLIQLKAFMLANKQHFDTKLDTVSSELDDVRTDVEDLAAEVKELQTCLDYLREIIGIRASRYKLDQYKHTLYLSLRWYLSSSYAAALVVSSSEEMVAFGKAGTTGKIGGMLEAVSPHVPMGGGIIVQFFASILKSIDERYQKSMVENYAKLAPGTMGMEVLSHEIAVKIIDVIATLDIDRIESSTNSIARECIDMVTNAVIWASNNKDQIEAAVQKPILAVEKSAIALIANKVQENIVKSFTKKVKELSNVEQRGQKHALVIATLLISKIYTLKIKEQNLIYNMEAIKTLIDDEIVRSYTVSGTASATHSTIAPPSQGKSSPCPAAKKQSKCIVSYVLETPYDNEILNNPELLKVAYKIRGAEAASKLIDLGQDERLANAIVEATKYYTPEYVISTILLTNKNNYTEEDITFASYKPESLITNNKENVLQEIDQITEQTFFLNNAKGKLFIQNVADNFDERTLLAILELRKDYDTAEQILFAIDELGVDKVLEIFFCNEGKASILEITQTQDEEFLETVTKIEDIIGKEALAELTGWHQYIYKSLSNNLLSGYAIQVIQTIGSLINNLEEWLDFGVAYEDIDINNQVAIILTSLENMFDFIASDITYVGMPRRYPGFDPDDYSSNDGNGYNKEKDNVNSIDFSSLFVGLNSTNSEL